VLSIYEELFVDKSAFKTQLVAEQFDEIVEVSKPAHEAMGLHTHSFEAKALITQGELSIAVNDVSRLYKEGDVFQLAANTPHTEQYGPTGVTYLVGRKTS
jgi:quercetin dioxygenase-like cupin family protein